MPNAGKATLIIENPSCIPPCVIPRIPDVSKNPAAIEDEVARRDGIM